MIQLKRTQNQDLARELYLRVEAKEANFADLAAKYSEGPEQSTNGIVGQAVFNSVMGKKLKNPIGFF